MSTFAERKAERKASGQKQYDFSVVAGFPFAGEVVGRSNSKHQAYDFAFKQISSFAGDTAAHRAICARHRDQCVPTSLVFHIHREIASQSKTENKVMKTG